MLMILASWGIILTVVLQFHSRQQIQQARARGLWPQLGEFPTIEYVKRLAQAGEMILAIKLYRQIHGAPLADAKAAVEKLVGQLPRTPVSSPPAVRNQRASGKQRWSQMSKRGWLGVCVCVNGFIMCSLLGFYDSPGSSRLEQSLLSMGPGIFVIGLGCGLVFWGRAAWRNRKLTRREIQQARETGLWPPLGEIPTLEHVKRMAQAGEKFMAIKLYRQIHGAGWLMQKRRSTVWRAEALNVL